jgi:hypothetical protein
MDLVAQSELLKPRYIYGCKSLTRELWRTDLITAKQSCVALAKFWFDEYCSWCEFPGESLLITDGSSTDVVSDVARIDTLREFAVTKQSPMLSPRRSHASLYHAQCVYVLGGYDTAYMRQCERYECSANRWEALPQLPTACRHASAVVVAGSLYVLGGNGGQALDLIQKLRLEELTWELMPLRLPSPAYCISCFTLSDTEAYLVINSALYSFPALELLRTLPRGIKSWFGPSYYSRGTLYCSYHDGAARSVELGL